MVSNEAQIQPRKKTSTTRSQAVEKKIMGVPARIMKPRLLFLALVAILICFGLVMIYSASSVEAMSSADSNYDANYYVVRQGICIVAGLIAAAFAALIDYRALCRALLFIWIGTLALLLAVWLLGSNANGATRWVQVGPVRLQPSEFAKATVVLAAANIANRYYIERCISTFWLVVELAVFVGIPLGLILIQPDKGTVGIIAVMLAAVAVTAGFPASVMRKLIIVAVAIALVVVFKDDYSRQRVLTMLDPASDPYDTGWQLNQGFIAFGSGGLFGVGLGMSRQKYSYLPEAHNDFIFAIIGEELGLVGTLLVVLAFALLLYEALQIARQAPDMLGNLIVIGSITLLITQFFLNVMGVLGIFPLSGKTLPFLSYGGSSIIGCLILVGLITNVSLRSTLPETVHDERRRAMALASAEEDTGVGEAHPRSSSYREAPLPATARRGSQEAPQRRGLSLIEGGASEARTQSSSRSNSGGYTRINLNSDPSSRLRSDGVQKRDTKGYSSNNSRSSRPKRRS